MAPESDYYDILGVAADADSDQIRKAFRERVRACHPDRVANLDDDLRRLAEEKMVALNEAYAVLRNPARRAAYDDRYPSSIAEAAPVETSAQTPPSAPTEASTPEPPEPARNRIGEQQFVARAASEEFEQYLKHLVPGKVDWSPIDAPGMTLTLRASRARRTSYFVLSATSRLDSKGLRRFLQRLTKWSGSLRSGMWRPRVFGFAAAVEFVGQERLRRILDDFNGDRRQQDTLQPATMVDLVNWHVAPGDIDFRARLETLFRGS